MRNTPPLNFDVKEFFKDVRLFQGWGIFPGIRTGGKKNVELTLDRLSFPRDLTGKRVLDVAAWNGFFSFECVRRGAREVVALSPEDPNSTGFNQTQELLEVNNVHYVRDSIYNADVKFLGHFDIVLFLGIIYHLRHPLLALDVIHDLSIESLFVDSAIIDGGDQLTRLRGPEAVDLKCWAEIQSIPLIYYVQADEWTAERDKFNWFVPNAAALRDWITTSGFAIEATSRDPGWAWVKARKTKRTFRTKLEGFNPEVAKRRAG